jgi:hypothetical protein
MLTSLLLVPLLALQVHAEPEPEFWPWDTVFEWEVNYWEWLGDEGGELDKIPKNAQMIVGVKLYEKFGRQAYACADVGREATLRVALVPKGIRREEGLVTEVDIAICRPQPQNGATHGFVSLDRHSVYTSSWKFGERFFLGGGSFSAGGKKRAWHAFTLTIRECKQDKKGLIKDYFVNRSSPDYQHDRKRLQTDPVRRAGAPGK